MIIKNIEMFTVVMLLETKLTGKTVHQKNSMWCWLRRNFGQFDAKNPDQVLFATVLPRGGFSFANILDAQCEVWTTGGLQDRERVVGAGWWVAGWQGGRGRVMGGVERWREVWMGWSHQNQKNPNFGQVQKLFGNYNPRAASSHLLCFVTFLHSNTFISLQFQP